MQVRQEGFPLQAGTSYQWKVDLKTSAALSVPIKITLAHDPWTTVASFSCAVGTEWTTCAPPPFTVTATDTYKFEIDLGNAGASKTNGIQAYIDNMYRRPRRTPVSPSAPASCVGMMAVVARVACARRGRPAAIGVSASRRSRHEHS
ncbi:hypothetical protein ACN28S_11235 [Cystobacter fuscus]